LREREVLTPEFELDKDVFTEDALKFEIHKSIKEYQVINKQSIPLNDCFQLFTRKEKLSAEDAWYCSLCKEHREATKKMELWKLPQILVIHIKRFQYSKLWREKIDILVDFPLTSLNLKDFIVNVEAQDTIYDLYAVSNHSGGLGGGHYTASIKYNDGNWYYCNDSNVSKMKESEVVCEEAYVLFYYRRDTTAEPTPSTEHIINTSTSTT